MDDQLLRIGDVRLLVGRDHQISSRAHIRMDGGLVHVVGQLKSYILIVIIITFFAEVEISFSRWDHHARNPETRDAINNIIL